MTTNRLPALYCETSIAKTSARKLSDDIMKDKTAFVCWVRENIKSESMRKLAIELGAHRFLNEYYGNCVEWHQQRIEELYEFRLRLLERLWQHRKSLVIEYQQLELTLDGIGQQRVQIANQTRKLLEPPSREKDPLEKLRDQDKREMLILKMKQRRSRFIHRATMSSAAERAKLRSELIAELREALDDPELVEDAIDEFDRIIFSETRNN